MSNWSGPKFTNPNTGETFIHNQRPDGTKELKTVRTGVSGDRGSHSVIGNNGVPKYIREGNRTVADDRLG